MPRDTAALLKLKGVFAKQLRKAIEIAFQPTLGNRWDNEDFAHLGGFPSSSVSAWLNGTSVPEYPTLLKIAQLLKTSTDFLLKEEGQVQMLSENPPLRIITDKKIYVDERENILTSSVEELWIQVRTAVPLLESLGILQELMQKGVSIRLLVCDPTDPSVNTMVKRRKYPWFSDKENPSLDTIRMLNRITDLAIQQNAEDKLEIKVVLYFPSTAMYIADPYQDQGRLFAVTVNYKLNPYLAPVVIATRKDHLSIFEAYRTHYVELWADARRYERIEPDESIGS
jgi:transcriptional regulator with XRE-family HTH domain